MNTTSKAYLFITVFSLCLIGYLLLPVVLAFFSPSGESTLWLKESENTGTEFIQLLLIAAVVAFVLTGLIEYGYARVRKWRLYRPRIGEIMRALDLISGEDLRKALAQQQLRLSEILVRAGRLTPEQSDMALELQKKNKRKIGEILLQLGFISEKDLRWALEERNKKIGVILKEMKLVTDYDIDCALMLEKRGRLDKNGRIIDMD